MSERPVADDSIHSIPDGFYHGFQFRNKRFLREFAPSVKRDIGLIGVLNDTIDGSQSFLEHISISQFLKISPHVYRNQNPDERFAMATKRVNGVGFNKHDAPVLTPLAEKYLVEGYLFESEMETVHHLVPKYWRQWA